jgi:protein arginine N-methyltransferase 5
VAPISSEKLWNEVNSLHELKHFETAYVVKMHNFYQLAPSKACFTFEHPNYSSPIDNCRYQKLHFEIEEAALLHGFGGYFECTLYKEHLISINPQTFSEGMFSWFPLFFPLKTPMYVPAGSTVEVHYWRCVANSKVWYEWCVTSPDVHFVQNPNGRSYWIGL